MVGKQCQKMQRIAAQPFGSPRTRQPVHGNRAHQGDALREVRRPALLGQVLAAVGVREENRKGIDRTQANQVEFLAFAGGSRHNDAAQRERLLRTWPWRRQGVLAEGVERGVAGEVQLSTSPG